MTGCFLARPDDRPALMALWMRCFEEEPAALDSFFAERFVPENCVVWRQDGVLAAALHLLPASLEENGRPVPIHYLYAAATLPEYRGRGIMRAMLEQVCQVIAPARGGNATPSCFPPAPAFTIFIVPAAIASVIKPVLSFSQTGSFPPLRSPETREAYHPPKRYFCAIICCVHARGP